MGYPGKGRAGFMNVLGFLFNLAIEILYGEMLRVLSNDRARKLGLK
jgi:hypothetical protein